MLRTCVRGCEFGGRWEGVERTWPRLRLYSIRLVGSRQKSSWRGMVYKGLQDKSVVVVPSDAARTAEQIVALSDSVSF